MSNFCSAFNRTGKYLIIHRIMTSYLQHTFNLPNFVHFQQLAKSTFPEQGGAAAAAAMCDRDGG